MDHELHPILEQMSPSSSQLAPIQARGEDIVVTAGAGTGKTRTLVARYLSLLVDGLPLRSILAITFTKKAAREMRNRIRQEVRRYLQRDNHGKGDLQWWQSIYDGLDAARISTIHTLCAEILRNHPAECGVDPAFEMIEEGQMALYQAQAVDQTLGWAIDDQQTVQLFSVFGARELRYLLGRLLEKRLDVRSVLDKSDRDMWSTWKGIILDPIQDFVTDPEVQEHFQSLLALEETGKIQKAAEMGDALVPDLRTVIKSWRVIQTARKEEDWIRLSRELHPLRESLKQKGRKDNWKPAEPKTHIKFLQDRFDHDVAPIVKDGLDLALDKKLADDIVPALLQAFRRCEQIYTRKKSRERMLDFDDLEWKAVHVMKENRHVRHFWQKRIDAVLVDEFQDTNGRQRDLLELITGKDGELFIVGDGKQSIYRFRGADVAVFQEEEQAIRSSGKGFHLSTSYRAHKALIEALNTLLAPVLKEDPRENFRSPFEPLEPHRDQPLPGIESPYVEFHLSVGKKSQGALDRAAEVSVNRVIEIVGGGNEGDTDVGYGDIAILCRSSSSFPAYEKALEEAEVPYLTISGRGFYERPEVRDILNALRAIADPQDDLAMCGLLRSPVGGLSDMALYRLRVEKKNRELSSIYEVLFLEDLSFLSDEENQVPRIRALIQDLHRDVGRIPVARLMRKFLQSTAYLSALERAGYSRGKQNIRKLLSDAYQSGMVNISRFLSYVDELRDVSVREGEAQAISAGAVQIMTVHQAKGLEFPIVIIGDVSRGTPRIRDVILDERFGVVPPITEEKLVTGQGQQTEVTRMGSAVYRFAAERERDQEDAESDRLLYVAATRAQEKLLLSGVLSGIRKDGTPYSLKGWLEKLGTPLGLNDLQIPYDPDGEKIHTFQINKSSIPILCSVYEPDSYQIQPVEVRVPSLPAKLPDDQSLLEPRDAMKIREDPKREERERRIWRVVPRIDYPSAPAWLIGKLVHRTLSQWMFPSWEQERLRAWIRREAESSGLSAESHTREAVNQTMRLIAQFQNHALFEEMNSAQRRYHEIPYTTAVNGQIEQGVIDALYQKNGAWSLVEFKTDRVINDKEIDNLLQEKDYRDQVGTYLEVAENMLGQQPRPVLCFLNFQHGVKLIQDRW